MSWHGHTSHITGPLCGESPCFRWFPSTKHQSCSFDLLLACVSFWTSNKVVSEIRCLDGHMTSPQCNFCYLLKFSTNATFKHVYTCSVPLAPKRWSFNLTKNEMNYQYWYRRTLSHCSVKLPAEGIKRNTQKAVVQYEGMFYAFLQKKKKKIP